LVLTLLFPVVVLLSIYVSQGAFSHVYLVHPHKKPESFLRRNWDKIILGIFFLVLGMVAKSLWDAAWTKAAPPASAPQQAQPGEKAHGNGAIIRGHNTGFRRNQY